MKNLKSKNSINRKIWRYLILFSILILAFLWIFQVLFINQFYEWFKTAEIKNSAKQITDSYNGNNFEDFLEHISYNKNMCIEIRTSFGSNYTTELSNKGCMMGGDTSSIKNDFMASGSSTKTYKVFNEKFGNEALVYAFRLDSGTGAFITASMVPIDSTISILKNQLWIVTIAVLILSWVIAYFMSKRISKPLEELTQSARELSNGNYNANFTTCEDIDEINELATTLNNTKEELAKTDELRRDLMANVSHDLKTPLTMIRAYAEMVKDITYKNKSKREENLNVIIDETDRLNVLVTDILALSRMESNVGELNKEVFDLTELIKEILKRYNILESTENYHFIFDYKKALRVRADKNKLEQVIYNLINNAINYTGDDNTVKIIIDEASNNIKISIVDSGKGIKKEDIPHIWDKYYKSEKKHKRNMIGTGLGLSIVKNILKAHNFKYGVLSSIGKGTTFYFIIDEDSIVK